MEGWISLHRRLLDHWIFQNDKYLKAWIWFLLRANHTQSKILMGADLITIERGEFITSLYKICEATGLTNQNARTFIKLLENDKMVNKQTTIKLTKITILNYDSYQQDQQTSNKPTNKPTTNGQQTDNKPATTDNKENNVNNDNKKIPPIFSDVVLYCKERNKNVNPQKWYDHYEAKGWMIGKNKMKDWRAAVRTWEKEPDPREHKNDTTKFTNEIH